jgi:hypothetical protein
MTLSEPAGKEDVMNCALPPLNCTLPNTVFPIENVTGPLGVTVGDAMVAVNVTVCPTADGFTDDVIDAALAPGCTTSFTAADELPRLLASPPYTAVIA